jgi:drug/metabolite transporter (DMT)-like permease
MAIDTGSMSAHTSAVARLALATTVVLWASAFPAIRVAVPELGPAGLSVARLLVASLALAVVAPFVGLRRPAARDLPLVALCGLAGMTAYQLLLNAGERVVPAGTASLLVATAPIYSVLLAAALLGERPTARRCLGSLVAFAGCAVIAVSHGGVHFGAAALIVLAAAVVQGIYHTAHKPLLARYTGFEVTVYAMWAGTLLVLPWSPALVRALPHADGAALAAAVFLGIAPSALGFLTWAYAVARVDISYATASLYLVPAVAVVTAFVWLGETPSPLELVGGAVALAGVVLANTGARQRRVAADRLPVGQLDAERV